jgi:hypothetical protein
LIASGVHLIPVYGGTEFGVPGSFLKRSVDEKDWEYMSITPRAKVRWDDQGDGTYELQFLVRFPLLLADGCMLMPLGQTCETHQLAIENLPDVKGYATSDLWTRHPTNPDFWKMSARFLFIAAVTLTTIS